MLTRIVLAHVVLIVGTTSLRAEVTFEWAVIGNPGNPGELSGDGAGGFGIDAVVGAVEYTYRISKHEVTNAQYAEFLNAVDPSGVNRYSLYHEAMTTHATGGIDFDAGAPNGSKYATRTGRDRKPVNLVSFYDSMRFINWLENGQGNGSTEFGVYTIGNGSNETRDPAATYFLPNESEWYKAAYHMNDGAMGNYWDFPTATDQIPDNNLPVADTGNSANYFNAGLTTGIASDPMTEVGSYLLSVSPYGTFDQAGNVAEWNETLIIVGARGVRGGSWGDYNSGVFGPGKLSASWRDGAPPFDMNTSLGFRVASIAIPEPSGLVLGVFSCFGSVTLKRRDSLHRTTQAGSLGQS